MLNSNYGYLLRFLLDLLFEEIFERPFFELKS